VAIKGCAREAGERTKIAVQSRDRDVDSVGACVGMKGMRVQSIIRELRGEKIDIIEYSDDPVVFATHALSPAKVSRIVVIDALEKHMEVIVDDSQLSLAIGKKGQNVRLAAKLLGWKIDIKSEEEKRQEVESQMAALVAPGAPVSVLLEYGMSDAVSEKLAQAGVGTIERLGTMTPEELEAIPGIDPASVEFIQASVVAYYSQFEDPGTEGVEPAEGGEGGEPVEPVEGSSAAFQPEEILLSGPAEEDGEDGEPAPQSSQAPAAAATPKKAAAPVADPLGVGGDDEVAVSIQGLAGAGIKITLLLEDEIDISRGDMIVKTGELPNVTKQIDAMLCWLSESPLDPRRKYLIRHTTRDSKAMLAGIEFRMDINTMEHQAAEKLAMNDIAKVSFKLAQPIFADAYANSRGTGAFIVIDESSNNTVGAGMIL